MNVPTPIVTRAHFPRHPVPPIHGHEAIEATYLDPSTRDRFALVDQQECLEEAWDASAMECLAFTRTLLPAVSPDAVLRDGAFPHVEIGVGLRGELMVRRRCADCGELWWAQSGQEHRCEVTF